MRRSGRQLTRFFFLALSSSVQPRHRSRLPSVAGWLAPPQLQHFVLASAGHRLAIGAPVHAAVGGWPAGSGIGGVGGDGVGGTGCWPDEEAGLEGSPHAQHCAALAEYTHAASPPPAPAPPPPGSPRQPPAAPLPPSPKHLVRVARQVHQQLLAAHVPHLQQTATGELCVCGGGGVRRGDGCRH